MIRSEEFPCNPRARRHNRGRFTNRSRTGLGAPDRREEAIEEVAKTNQNFDLNLAAAKVGKITVTVDHPIRVVYPTDEERTMYAIEDGVEAVEEAEEVEA